MSRKRTSTPGVFQLIPSGRYQATFRAGGRQRSRSFGTLREARAFLAQTRADLARGAYLDPAGGRTTFGAWVGMWLETRKVRASTAARTQWALTHYLLPRFRDRPLGVITPREVRLWVAELEGLGLARATVEGLYRLLSQVMAEATDEDLIARSPCRGVKLSTGLPAREARALTAAEATRLLDALSAASGVEPSSSSGLSRSSSLGALSGSAPAAYDTRLLSQPGAARNATPYTLVLTLLGTGMRYGEAAGLRRRHVHLLRRPPAVEVREALHEVNGALSIGPPKTRSSVRTIPLPSVVAEALSRHLPPNGDPDDLVFTTVRGRPLRRTNFASAVWWPAVRAAGLDGVRVHDCRHTFASVLENGGVPQVITAELLGHAGRGSVTSGYLHAYQETINQAVEVVDAWLRGMVGGQSDSVAR